MRSFFESFATAFLILFTLPTILVVASWNMVPGESLFPIKIGLEKAIAFVVAPSYDVSTALQMRYTERRYAEAKRMIAEKHSVVGLAYLTAQVAQTQKTISNAPRSASQTQTTRVYIATLQSVSDELEAQKQLVLSQAQGQTSTTQSAVVTNAPQPTPTPTPTPIQTAIAALPQPSITINPTPIPTVSPTPVIIATVSTANPVPSQTVALALTISQTQQQLQQTIQELEDEVEENDEEDKKDRSGKQKDRQENKGKRNRNK